MQKQTAPVQKWFHQPIQTLQRVAQQPTQLVTATALLTVIAFSTSSYLIWQTYQNFARVIQQEFRLRSLSDRITYLDEVLTMSAQMNAATGDQTWEQRYRQSEPKLDAAIRESMQIAPETYSSADAKQTDLANQRLVIMENQSFRLVAQGQHNQALALLSSPNYQQEKQNYAEGVARRNQLIQQQLQASIADYQHSLFWSSFTLALGLLILIPIWILILRILRSYLQEQTTARIMLATSNQQLESQVQRRTFELEQKNTELQNAMQLLKSQQMQLIQAEKMSGLGQLMAGIAHEINNPVNFIHGNLDHLTVYTQDLLELIQLYQNYYPDSPKIQHRMHAIDLNFLQEDVSKILQSLQLGTTRIREIVLSMRTFSRMDEAGYKITDIHQGIDSTLLILQHRLKARDNQPEITVVKNYGILPEIECYPGQLNQVFMNILTNAIDAIDASRLEVTQTDFCGRTTVSQITITTLVTQSAAGQPDSVIITIADNGCGIPEAIQAQIFDPFFTTKPVGQGTGLGMSISYQIIADKHHGKLTCHSQPGVGTAFTILLPVQQPVSS
jgi:signal transduction histidine kinase